MFDSLFEIMTEHLTEEEEYWPGIIKEYGKPIAVRMDATKRPNVAPASLI